MTDPLADKSRWPAVAPLMMDLMTAFISGAQWAGYSVDPLSQELYLAASDHTNVTIGRRAPGTTRKDQPK